MTRRLHDCLRCGHKKDEKRGKFSLPRGLTRHANGLCGQCRRAGARLVDGKVVGPVLDTVSYAGRDA
jgi:hypothetical protein